MIQRLVRLRRADIQTILMADLSKWRLTATEGRQVWSYEEAPEREQSFAEKYFLGVDKPSDSAEEAALPNSTPEEKLHQAIRFYSKLQLSDGHWGNDYGGPMFLLPGLVITCFITGSELAAEKKLQMIRYLRHMQRKDGGWGLHIESPSTMFGSALTYVTLRLLGVASDDPAIIAARQWITANGEPLLDSLRQASDPPSSRRSAGHALVGQILVGSARRVRVVWR